MKHFAAVLVVVALVGFLSGCGGGGGGSGGGSNSGTGSSNATTVQGVVSVASGVALAPGAGAHRAIASGNVAVPNAVVSIAGTDKSATTDSSGAFSIAGVSPGNQILIVKITGSDGTVYACLKVIEVPNGNGTSTIYDVGEQLLTAAGSIQGVATLSDQSDYTGILVFIPGTSYSANTDSVGNFTISNVPSGTNKLDYSKSGYTTIELPTVTVNSGAATTVHAVGLSPSGSGASGNTPPGADNLLVNVPENGSVSFTLSASDVNGDTLTYSIVQQPSHGTLLGTAPNLTYTPTVNYNGTDAFTFKANDGKADSDVATISITVLPVPVITSATTDTGVVGTAFTYTITATNTPTGFDATGLPSGLSVNTTTGVISGTPIAAGSSNVAISAANTNGTGTAILVLTVSEPVQSTPVISSVLTATGTVGSAFNYTIVASNYPTIFDATSLPAGLTVATATGLISGTPTGAGSSSVTISATNAGGTGSATLVLTVNPPVPVISSATTATVTVGVVFNYTITATNAPTSYGTTGLPADLSVNTSTGVISGTPTSVGTSSVTIIATNAGGTGSATLTLTVNPPAPVISSSTTATGAVGSAFTYTIAASNSPSSFSAAGLPSGLSVSTATGVISGTPTTAGSSSFTISATNVGGTGTAILTLTINANTPPTMTSISNQAINKNSATGALSFTIGDAETLIGSLLLSKLSSNTTLVPLAGIVFGGSGASRTVTVTPATNQYGTATITITVTDGGGLQASTNFTLSVNSPPTMTGISSQLINENTSTSALAFTVGDLETPVGSLTVTGSSSNTTLVPNANIVFGGSGASRNVTVTPASNQSGVVTITISVSDGMASMSANFVLTVNDPPTISNIASQHVYGNHATNPISFTIGDDLTSTNSLTLAGSSSNTTFVPNANIVFGGSGASRNVTLTPATNQFGSTEITITVTDGGGLQASSSFSLSVVGESLVWARSLSWSNDSRAGVAVCGDGSSIVSGGSGGALTKYNASGTSIWYGGVAPLYAFAVDSFSDGNSVVAGGVAGGVWGNAAIAMVDQNGSSVWSQTGVASRWIGVAGLSDDSSVVIGNSNPPGTVIVAKYSSSGALSWWKQLGVGTYASCWAGGISAFPDGSFAITGSFDGTIVLGVGETNQATLIGEGVYIAKYNSDGTLAWAKGVNVNYSGFGGIGSFNDGSLIITGGFSGTANFGGVTLSTVIVTNTNVFVARYNSDSTLAWAKRMGSITGVESDTGYAVAVNNSDGSAVITGAWTSTIFVTKFNLDGTVAGGGSISAAGEGVSVAVASDGSTTVAGTFTGTAIFGFGEQNQTALTDGSGFGSIFIARFAP